MLVVSHYIDFMTHQWVITCSLKVADAGEGRWRAWNANHSVWTLPRRFLSSGVMCGVVIGNDQYNPLLIFKMHITFDPAVPLLGIQPREMPAEELREAWRRHRKQLNVEYYAALQKDEVGLHCGDISGTFGEIKSRNQMCSLLSVLGKTHLYMCMYITCVDAFEKDLERNPTCATP